MKIEIFIPDTLKKYFECIYLAEYYRWLASKSTSATGNRSPINGKQYTIGEPHHTHLAYKKGYIAMAKVYIQTATEIRKKYKFNI